MKRTYVRVLGCRIGVASRAGIPDHVQFSTKYQLAQQMIERARAAGTPFAWVTADEVYGQAEPLRDYLEREKKNQLRDGGPPHRKGSHDHRRQHR